MSDDNEPSKQLYRIDEHAIPVPDQPQAGSQPLSRGYASEVTPLKDHGELWGLGARRETDSESILIDMSSTDEESTKALVARIMAAQNSVPHFEILAHKVTIDNSASEQSATHYDGLSVDLDAEATDTRDPQPLQSELVSIGRHIAAAAVALVIVLLIILLII